MNGKQDAHLCDPISVTVMLLRFQAVETLIVILVFAAWCLGLWVLHRKLSQTPFQSVRVVSSNGSAFPSETIRLRPAPAE
jgi:hypothetical protein